MFRILHIADSSSNSSSGSSWSSNGSSKSSQNSEDTEPDDAGRNKDREETRYAQNEQNTSGLVAVLMVGVTSIFLAFAGAALCYRFLLEITFVFVFS